MGRARPLADTSTPLRHTGTGCLAPGVALVLLDIAFKGGLERDIVADLEAADLGMPVAVQRHKRLAYALSKIGKGGSAAQA